MWTIDIGHLFLGAGLLVWGGLLWKYLRDRHQEAKDRVTVEMAQIFAASNKPADEIAAAVAYTTTPAHPMPALDATEVPDNTVRGFYLRDGTGFIVESGDVAGVAPDMLWLEEN